MEVQAKTAINSYYYFFVVTKDIKKEDRLLAEICDPLGIPCWGQFLKSSPLLFVVLTPQMNLNTRITQSFGIDLKR